MGRFDQDGVQMAPDTRSGRMPAPGEAELDINGGNTRIGRVRMQVIMDRCEQAESVEYTPTSGHLELPAERDDNRIGKSPGSSFESESYRGI